MTARGAADFLTRATSILGAAFIVLSIVLAAIAGGHAREPEDRHVARAAAHRPAAPAPAAAPARGAAGPGRPARAITSAPARLM